MDTRRTSQASLAQLLRSVYANGEHTMSTPPENTEVAIVGAGPTGLTLACTLAAKHVPFLLLDRLSEGANTSRAAVIHARTLEVLEPLGVTSHLLARGHIVPRFTLRDRDQVLASVPFDRLKTRYPFTLMLPQQHTEAVLLDQLHRLGSDVHRPCSVERVVQDAAGASVEVRADGAAARTIRARYVVGCDGMHSRVREDAGIAFTGDSYAQSFVLADVRMTWPIPGDEVMLFLSPEGLVVVAPLPGGTHRIVATVDEAPEQPDLGDVQRLLDARGPARDAARVEEIVWSSRFRVHHRIAERYRAGRLLLAGDAAHVHSPAGGQGMNTGIQDAVALGQALVSTIADGDERALDRYAQLRRPVAQRVVSFTDRMTVMATLRSARARLLRNTALRLIGHTAITQRLAYELAGLRNRAA